MRRLLTCAAFLAACGGGSGHTGDDIAGDDAPIGDASIDADPDADPDAMPDAPGTSVRVEAFSIDGPLAGVKVAFLDASDATLTVVTTAADGIATGPAGGSVIAASPTSDHAFLWRAVEDGDVLHARFDVTTTMHAVTFTLPTGGANYRVITRCGRSALSSSRVVTTMLPTSCTTSDVIAQQYIGGLDKAIHVAAQSLTGTAVDLSALAWTGTTSYTIVANGVTANSVQIGSAARIGDVYAPGDFYSTSGQNPIGTATTSGEAIVATGAEVVVRVEIMSGTALLQQIYRGAPPSPAFDGASRLVAIGTPAYNTSTHTLTWNVGGVGDPPDTVRATLVFPGLTWDFVSPHVVTSTTLRIPTLPPELSSVDPGTTVPTTRRMRGYALPGGYDRARSAMFGAVETDELLAQSGLLRTIDSTPP